MANNSPGWAVELIGDEIDLDDFRKMLAPPFDPWTEDSADGKLLLRSDSWAKFTEAIDVFRDAFRMIERLNGEALLINNDAKPVKLGGQVIRFAPDGTQEQTFSPGTADLRLTLERVRLRSTGTTGGQTEPQNRGCRSGSERRRRMTLAQSCSFTSIAPITGMTCTNQWN